MGAPEPSGEHVDMRLAAALSMVGCLAAVSATSVPPALTPVTRVVAERAAIAPGSSLEWPSFALGGPATTSAFSPASSYSGVEASPDSFQPLTLYVSSDGSHVQDVTISNRLACAPNGKTFRDTFTLSSAAINPDGSFTGSESHHGVLTLIGTSFPATFSYAVTGQFTGSTASGTWQETVTYNDGTSQTCTTNPLPWSVTRDTQEGSQASASPPAGSYSGPEASPDSFQPLTLYVSTDGSRVQDVTISNRLECVPNSKTFRDTFTLSSAAINPDGSLTGSASHHGVLTLIGASFPATYSYAFAGNFHAVNNTGVERAAGTWQETVTYNDGTAQTCTTNPLPWSVTRDTQGSQAFAASPPAGSYSGPEASPDSFQPLTLYVSSDGSHVQDVTISNRLACVPNSKTFRDTFTLSRAAINPDGSLTGSASHHGVLTLIGASFPATYSYAFAGNFHAVNNTGVERADGTWQETVTYNDGTRQTCTTNPLPWSVTRDTQGSQAAASPPAGSYSGPEASPDSFQPLTLHVSSDGSHIQHVTISNRLACVPNSKTFRDIFTLASAGINPDGSFAGSASHHGVLTLTGKSFPATYSYAFAGNFHAVNSTGVERAAGTWQETVTYNDGTRQTCTTNPLPWSVTHT